MNKFKEGFKNWLTINKKTLIKIFFWLIYITLVVIFVRYINSKANDKIEEFNNLVIQLKELDNYEYECYYNDVSYSGKVNGNIEIMYVGDEEYYYDGKWYKNDIETDEVIPRIKPKEIYTIIEVSEYNNSREVNDLTEVTYKVNSNELGYDTNQEITIYVYLSDEEVRAVTILGQACVYNNINKVERLDK